MQCNSFSVSFSPVPCEISRTKVPEIFSDFSRPHRNRPVEASLLFIIAAIAATLIFYYNGLDLLSPRCGCFTLSFLALNRVLPAKRVKEPAN